MFTKPNGKSITSTALAAGSLVVGSKVGDGLAAVMPESVAPYKRWIIGVGAVVAAACIAPKTTVAQASQNALLGMGAKQLYDELTDQLTTAIPIKEATTSGQRFVNAVVTGLNAPAPLSNNAPWIGDNSNMWERQEEALLPTSNFV